MQRLSTGFICRSTNGPHWSQRHRSSTRVCFDGRMSMSNSGIARTALTARPALTVRPALTARIAPADDLIVDWMDDDDTVDTGGANGGADPVHPLQALGGVLPQDCRGSLFAGLEAGTAAEGIGDAKNMDDAGRAYGARNADHDISAECKREAPRFILTPGACAVIVLVLTVALCACLVLLIKQGTALAQFAQGEESAYSRSSTHTDEGNGGTAHSGAATQSSSAQSDAEHSSMQPSVQPSGQSPGQSSGQPSVDSSADSSMEPSAQQTQPPDSGASGDGSSAGGGLVNINTATSEQLQTVKGIGPATARKIIEYRDAHGPFASVDELLNIDGIGAKTVQKLRGKVTV